MTDEKIMRAIDALGAYVRAMDALTAGERIELNERCAEAHDQHRDAYVDGDPNNKYVQYKCKLHPKWQVRVRNVEDNWERDNQPAIFAYYDRLDRAWAKHVEATE